MSSLASSPLRDHNGSLSRSVAKSSKSTNAGSVKKSGKQDGGSKKFSKKDMISKEIPMNSGHRRLLAEVKAAVKVYGVLEAKIAFDETDSSGSPLATKEDRLEHRRNEKALAKTLKDCIMSLVETLNGLCKHDGTFTFAEVQKLVTRHLTMRQQAIKRKKEKKAHKHARADENVVVDESENRSMSPPPMPLASGLASSQPSPNPSAAASLQSSVTATASSASPIPAPKVNASFTEFDEVTIVRDGASIEGYIVKPGELKCVVAFYGANEGRYIEKPFLVKDIKRR